MDAQALTLRQIRYFLAVAETLHFRHAAERCGVSQPSLSAQIQELEAALGVRLLDRGRSGVALTPLGREIAAQARRVQEEVQSLADLAAGAQKGLAGLIRLGVKPTLGPYLLPHVVSRLHRQHKALNLYVRESPPRELEFELVRGVHDVILAHLPVAGAELEAERLFREPLYLAIAVDHPLAREAAIPLDALGQERILTLSPAFRLHDQVEEICREVGAELARDYEGTSLDALRQMVGMGMGVAFLPALYVRSEIPARSEVLIKPIRGRAVTRAIGLVWRKRSGAASAFREIAGVIREVAARKFPELTIER